MFLAKNYRPVSLLSVISKVLEKAIFLQLFKYLEENSLIHPSHHAYRPSHNTTTALIEMIDFWVEAFEDDEISAAVMCDQSAAFDVCDHKILKDKLEIYGLQEGALAWISSYLENRKQTVYIEGKLSDIKELEDAGVPQGGTLSPLLYNLFCCDLPEAIHAKHSDSVDDVSNENDTINEYKMKSKCDICGTKTVCYADDCTYNACHKDPLILQAKIEKDFKIIADYMTDNKLFLNSDKTHLLIMTSSRSHSLKGDFGIKLNTGTEIIEPSQKERLLGANLTNDFLWKDHLRDNKKSVISVLKTKNNALSMISHYSSFLVRK